MFITCSYCGEVLKYKKVKTEELTDYRVDPCVTCAETDAAAYTTGYRHGLDIAKERFAKLAKDDPITVHVIIKKEEK